MTITRAPAAGNARLWPLILVAVPYFWFAVNNYSYELDDALIYMRYIQNLIDGNGLVYNKGVRFDGLTSPLFSYITAIIAMVSRNARFATWLASAASTYAAFGVFYLIFLDQLGRTQAMPRVTAVLGLVISATIPYFFSTYGMETGLFALLCALTLGTCLARRWDAFCLCGTLLVLTRPEGLALVAACGVYQIFVRRKLPPVSVRTLAIAAGLVACIVAANLFFFHEPWAETGAAKIWQGKSGYWGDHFIFWDVYYLKDVAFAGSPVSALIVLVAAAIGIVVLGASELNIIWLLFLLSYGAFYTIFNIPNYHWYFSAFFMLMPYYAATGGGYIASTLVAGDTSARAKILAFVVLGTVIYPVYGFVQTDAAKQDSSGAPYAQAGRWIRANTPPDSSFAATEIGALGWYSNRPVVDILGLVDAGNARLIGERNFDGWVAAYRPDYLLVHDPVNALEMSFYTFSARFALTQQCDFHVSGYLFYKIEYDHRPSTFCIKDYSLQPIDIASPKVLSSTDSGHVDYVTLTGNFVRMIGWATDGEGHAFSSLVAQAGHDVDFGVYARVSRPDVARDLHSQAYDLSGYDLVLRFPTYAQAKEWAAHPCLLSSRRQFAAPLHDVDLTACGLSMSFANGFE